MIVSPLRVLCVDHEGGYGGSSRSLFHLLRYVKNADIDVEVWCAKTGPIQSQYAKIGITARVVPRIPTATTLYRLSRNIVTIGQAVWRLWRWRKWWRNEAATINQNYDLVHFNHPNLFLLARWLRRHTEVPFTMHMRTTLENLYEGFRLTALADAINRSTSMALAKWQIRTISSCTNWIAFISKNEWESFFRLGGTGIGQVIHNVAINPTVTTGSPSIPKDTRFKIASVENYRWSRGTDRLIDISAALARRERYDFLFVVAGDMSLPASLCGRLGDIGRQGGTLADYVREIGLSDYFLFLGPVTDPERVLLSCDVVASLTRRVGAWGRTVIEAMACGRPVVAVGPATGFVEHDHTGILHEEFDADVLAEELIRLKQDEATYIRLAEAAQKKIREVCDGDARSADLLAGWRSTVARQ